MAKWERNGNTIKWSFKNGQAWIDHVTIEDIDCVEVTEEMINLYKNGVEKANAIKGYVDEAGFYEYDKNGNIDETSRRIVYEY